ncbi:MAG: hypothetical protein CTY36_09490 [Methylocystis sp.]|nr:MAG: hypothetical protein CTY30_13610 [Methylocystis sp.]PPD02318.1 MAG: hypothetical protein CTY36_09490 [Methylocystis sp.]
MARVAEPLWTPGFCRGSRLHARACETFTRNYSRRALACEAATNAEKICILPSSTTAALSL